MIAVIIIIAVVAGAIAVITAATRTRPPGRHTSNPAGEEDTFVAELRGQPWDAAPKPDHASQTMVPLYGADDAPSPQLGEPLKPLPEVASPVASPPASLFAEVADEIDSLIDEVRQRFNPRPGDKPRPAHARDGQTTGEIFEHLCEGPGCWCQPWTPTPDAPPAEIVAGLNGHYTVDAAVESMFTRAQAEQVRALANGQVSDG